MVKEENSIIKLNPSDKKMIMIQEDTYHKLLTFQKKMGLIVVEGTEDMESIIIDLLGYCEFLESVLELVPEDVKKEAHELLLSPLKQNIN